MPFSFQLWCAVEKIPMPDSSLAIWLPSSIFICGRACFHFAVRLRGFLVCCGVQWCFLIPGRMDGEQNQWSRPRCPLSLGGCQGARLGKAEEPDRSVEWALSVRLLVCLVQEPVAKFVRFSCVDRIGIHRTVQKIFKF